MDQRTCACRSTSLKVVCSRSEHRPKYLHSTHTSPSDDLRSSHGATQQLILEQQGSATSQNHVFLQGIGCNVTQQSRQVWSRPESGSGSQCGHDLRTSTPGSTHGGFRRDKAHSLTCTAFQKTPWYTKCFSRSTTCTTTAGCCTPRALRSHSARHADTCNVNTPLP